MPETKWKTDGHAYAVFISGSDVHIAGHTQSRISTEIVPCYWKNGTRGQLSTTGTVEKEGRARSIFVSRSDVYIAGETKNDAYRTIPCYWKNGLRTDLSMPACTGSFCDGWGYSIFVSGSDVYVAGTVEETTWHSDSHQYQSHSYPGYWKNGVWTGLSMASASVDANCGAANSIFVSGSDVHVAGEIYNASHANLTVTIIPCCWKNGVKTELDSFQAELLSTPDVFPFSCSIFISGEDVFVAGAILDNKKNTIPGYWQNGLRTNLENQGTSCAIVVSSGDVYVAGSTPAGPCYWKNRDRIDLPSLIEKSLIGKTTSIFATSK